MSFLLQPPSDALCHVTSKLQVTTLPSCTGHISIFPGKSHSHHASTKRSHTDRKGTTAHTLGFSQGRGQCPSYELSWRESHSHKAMQVTQTEGIRANKG